MSRPAGVGYRNMSNGSNPSLTSSTTRLVTPQSNLRPSSAGSSPAMSRADRFEDEKRRLVQSCFSKLDANGQLAESYITHIRIQEDSHYPSTPAPPDSSPENKKPRIIIISVRSTGRVRMHKARENNNGSFSIGKTWNMEELSAVESFSSNSVPPRDEREQQFREWAGHVGFTVTISKPYYWQAGTAKEKEFFIASAVKIYRKYTKGMVPELRGFDEQAKAMMLGGTPHQAPAPPSQQAQPLPASLTPGQRPQGPPTPPHPPFAQKEQSREGSRYRQSPGPPPSLHDPGRPGSSAASRHESPSSGRLGLGPRQFASHEHIRAASREGQHNDYSRPSTSSGPGHGRTPPPPYSDLTPPSAPYARSQRSESPSSSVASGRDIGPRVDRLRPHSPGRQRSYQHSVDSVREEGPANQPQPNDTHAGADLFQATKQRWMASGGQPPQASRQQTQSVSPTPQLPPIETSVRPSHSETYRTPTKTRPQTAASGASSGIDPNDVAAVGALPTHWGPDSARTTPRAPPAIQEPSSPPTPERSKRRPPMSPEKKFPGINVDLRPAPLRSSTKGSEEPHPTSPEQQSAQSLPKFEEPPEIKPLAVQNKRQSRDREDSTKLQMPGGFAETPEPSPSETPNETRYEQQAQEHPPEVEQEVDDEYRPGLGPMIKKDAVRNRFAKIASAARVANAFKPRPGGAAEKILKAKAEREGGGANGKPSEPDGITGVVPRPSAAAKREDDTARTNGSPSGLGLEGVKHDLTPKLEVSSPQSPVKALDSPSIMGIEQHRPVELRDEQQQLDHLQTPEQQQQQQDAEEQAEKALAEQREATRKAQVKIQKRSIQQERNLAALGIDRSLLEGKGLDFEATLADFGWDDSALEPHKLADIEAGLRREQGRLEAGSWLSHTDSQREEKVAQVEGLLEKAIQECDELEGLLTLYNVELSSLNDDISFIEAQSQGLQVQSANQRLLQTELKGLVATVSLDRRVLDPLRHGDLSDFSGLDNVEASLGRLYQALITIDPNIRSATSISSGGRPTSRRSGFMGEGGSELSSMRALREKREVYERESTMFCQRLMQHLDFMFASAFADAKSRVLQHADPSTSGPRRLNRDGFVDARRNLWVYGPEILFMREMNAPAWATALRIYYERARPVYKEAFGESILSWRRAAKRWTPDDNEGLLFTMAEKEDASASGASGGVGLAAARKLTIKRSQTLAKTLRNATGGNKSLTAESRITPGQMMRAEAFGAALDEMGPLILQEQNFVVDLFHASSLDIPDFLDAVQQMPPDQRHGSDLLATKPLGPDREAAKRVQGVMEEVFGFFAQEMGNLLEWALSSDPIQGVGVMASLSRHSFFLQDTNQEFLLRLLENLTTRLQGLWTKFVDEQIRAIEDTKVKIKKRRGVIGFMKVFPPFTAAVENVFSAVAKDDYESSAGSMSEVRRLVDETYNRLEKAMFESLKVIAKESPSAAVTTTAGQQRVGGIGTVDDSEDKEILNYHILLIENMNHYIEEVDDGGKDGVLAEWKGRALMERAEALEGYVGRVLRRPLGKLMDFLDQIDSLLPSHVTNPALIASRPSTSRKAARNVLSQYDSKEIRKGIDSLRKRIEKHFGEGDEEVLSRNLVRLVCKECERAYEKILERAERIVTEVYPTTEGEKEVEIEFSRGDVEAGFRR